MARVTSLSFCLALAAMGCWRPLPDAWGEPCESDADCPEELRCRYFPWSDVHGDGSSSYEYACLIPCDGGDGPSACDLYPDSCGCDAAIGACEVYGCK
jgi:hypothetical protein